MQQLPGFNLPSELNCVCARFRPQKLTGRTGVERGGCEVGGMNVGRWPGAGDVVRF